MIIFRYLPLTKLLNPANQTQKSFLYNFKFILSLDENQNIITNSVDHPSNASLLSNIRFFHVNLTNDRKPSLSSQDNENKTPLESKSPNASQDMLASITRFDDIPISKCVTT
jgi:hypothetical protein